MMSVTVKSSRNQQIQIKLLDNRLEVTSLRTF